MVRRFRLISLIVLGFVFGQLTTTELHAAKTSSVSKTHKAAGSPWRHVCAKSPNGKGNSCQIIQQLLVKKSKKILMSGSIRLSGKKNSPALMLQLPHGMFIPAGIAVRVDKKPLKKTAVQTCDHRGCFTGLALDDKMLVNMKKGKNIVVAFRNLKKQTIAISLSLKGFTAAYKKLSSHSTR